MTDTGRIVAARVTLDKARQAHMLALQVAIAAGTPATELDHDIAAFGRAARQLVTICTVPAGNAPMLLEGVG